MKAIRCKTVGGPEVLEFSEAPLPEPGKGEARVRMEAAGVNYIDIYHRTGLYPLPLPFTPGMEGAGVVEAMGANVREVRPGDRVAFAMHAGAYAQYAVVPSRKLVPLPSGISTETAAAAMLQGLTAHYLSHSTYSIQKGDTVLIHAAAGGVGLLLTQISKLLGARVLGTVSTQEKAGRARDAGADHAILYMENDFEEEVHRFTGGRGVNVVYDSVGKTTFEKSFRCLAPRGMLALFGQSSGTVPPIDLKLLSRASLFFTRPGLGDYVADREELLRRCRDLFHWIQSGKLHLQIHQTFSLEQAAEAHRSLEGRKTIGKLLLIP